MKNLLKAVLLISLLVISLTGCKNNEITDGDNSSSNGTEVIDSDNDIAEEEAVILKAMVLKASDQSIALITMEESGAFRLFDPVSASYSGEDMGLERGDIVNVTYNGSVLESYPGQIGAEAIEIIEKVSSDTWPALDSLPKEYPIEEAIKDQYVVIGTDGIESKERLTSFISNTTMGIIGFVRIVNYTVEGDSVISDIMFDGETYYVVEDISRDTFSDNEKKLNKYVYSYLNTFEKEDIIIVYLANEENISNEAFQKSLLSGSSSDWIEHYMIYSE